MIKTLALIALVVAFASAVAIEPPLVYPPTKRVDQFDDYHGVKVADPYRWLEGDVREIKEVEEWVAAENRVTNWYLNQIPQRDKIKKRLTDLWNYEKYSAPFKVAKQFYVFSKNDGLQNQSVYYKQDTLKSEPTVLLDPNKWSKDGTVALTALAFSEDGKTLAYGTSEAGSDWSIVHLLNVGDSKKLDDELRWIKFSGLSWTHDNKGFFYSRFPEPEKGKKFQGLAVNQKLYYHEMGKPQSDDPVIYTPDDPKFSLGGDVTDDGKFLVITVYDGTTSRKSKILVKSLTDPKAEIVPLIDDFESVNSVIDNDGHRFFVKTDRGAPRGRVVAINFMNSGRAEDWTEVIPETEWALQSVGSVGGLFTANYLKDAHTQLKIYGLDGKLVRDVKLPAIGTASGFGGRKDENETFYTFTNFSMPGRIYRYDMKSGDSTLFREPKVKFNPDDYVTTQVFYPSKDGTKIPMFITHKKGVKLDGNNPTLQYGYGGFNISLTPVFSIAKLVWMEMGGVYAQPNIRGGGEYGKAWHQAAVKLKRQTSYDDFIAASEWLIKNNYTKADRLAIQGGSNGGLLVGACMTQRPELYGATLPAVGVMDMLRFHKFTAGRYWVDDFGSADNADEFKVLRSYSPYHNLKKGVKYPATLVTTADTDDRVVPSHSFKFIAELQYCQAGDAPVLARIESRAGHGAGRPVSKSIEEVADQWAFLVKNLKMDK